MKRTKYLSLSVILAGVLTLSACGTSEKVNTQANNNSAEVSTVQKEITSAKETTDTQKETEQKKETISIADGTKKMKNIIEEIKEGLKDKNEDVVVKEASELDEVWEKFEDDVKVKSKDLYDQAEKPLGVIKAGIKVKPLDEKVLKETIEDLGKVLTSIQSQNSGSGTVSATSSIPDGVEKMKGIIGEMKDLVKDKNKEKLIKEANELDGVWGVFEDEVKEKSKDLYEKVETPMGVIKPGVKIEPLDTKTLNDSLDSLTKLLEEIEKLK